MWLGWPTYTILEAGADWLLKTAAGRDTYGCRSTHITILGRYLPRCFFEELRVQSSINESHLRPELKDD